MDDSLDSQESTPAPNSPALPLLDTEHGQRSVAFSAEEPSVRIEQSRKSTHSAEHPLLIEARKWWDNPPSEVWLALGVTLLLLLIAIIVIIVLTVNYNTLLEESKEGCRLYLRRRAEDD